VNLVIHTLRMVNYSRKLVVLSTRVCQCHWLETNGVTKLESPASNQAGLKKPECNLSNYEKLFKLRHHRRFTATLEVNLRRGHLEILRARRGGCTRHIVNDILPV
jgi:hypothetical protein